MSYILYLLFILFIVGQIQTINYSVYNEEELHQALSVVEPGDSINLLNNDGIKRIFTERFFIERNGTPEAPITLNGHPDVFFSNDSTYFGSINLNQVSNWVLSGLNFENGYWAIDAHNSYSIRFESTSISNYSYGVTVQDGRDIAFDGGVIESSNGIGLYFDLKNVIVENIDFRDTNSIQSPVYLFYAGGGTLNVTVRGNIFHVKDYGEDYNENPAESLIHSGEQGLIEGNTFYYESRDQTYGRIANFWASRQIVKNNKIYFKYIKSGNQDAFALSVGASRTVFEGNQIYYPKGNPSEPICISGFPQFHSGNTEIGEDNKCINGQLTNID